MGIPYSDETVLARNREKLGNVQLAEIEQQQKSLNSRKWYRSSMTNRLDIDLLTAHCASERPSQ